MQSPSVTHRHVREVAQLLMQLPRLSLRQKTIAMSASVFKLFGERSLVRASTSGALRVAGPARSLHVGEPRQGGADKSYKFVVCGAGPGGLAVASSLGRRFGKKSLAVIEPADVRKCQAVSEPVDAAPQRIATPMVSNIYGWSSGLGL